MKINPDNFCSKTQSGFSLVDVMVGMVIALLGMVIMFQVFSVSEGIKRTTTSGGDALQNGAAALYALEASLKQAGYGILGGVAKVTIAAGAANASDSITTNSMPTWEYGSILPDVTIFPSAVPPALTAETITTQLDANGRVRLVSIVGGVGTVISDGIALLKAEYGDDTNGDNIVDAWSQAAPVNAVAVRIAVVARSAQPEKRPAVCTPAVVPCPCDTTTANPNWSGSYVTLNNPTAVPLDISGNIGLDVSTTPPDDWKCYRYKTFENTVPLR